MISGGEPTVRLVDQTLRGKGGRNQQLVLAAVERLDQQDAAGVLVLSGGTDGEDGPTDAARALADASIIAEAKQQRLEASDYLRRNDAYHWFEPTGGLIKTGPTDTNVCDVRVVLVDRAIAARQSHHQRPSGRSRRLTDSRSSETLPSSSGNVLFV